MKRQTRDGDALPKQVQAVIETGRPGDRG